MIKVTFYKSNDVLTGFNIKGHSGYAERGSDIICASVSSAAFLVCNTITEVMDIKAFAEADDSGEITFKVPEDSTEKTNDILRGFLLHLTELSSQYPKNVTITTTEV